MHNSVKGEYALQAVLDLASRRAGEPIRIADIAQRQKIPQKFLELILASSRPSSIWPPGGPVNRFASPISRSARRFHRSFWN